MILLIFIIELLNYFCLVFGGHSNKLHGKITTESPNAIKDFLDDFYTSYGLNPKEDTIVHKMKREIDYIPHDINIKLSKRYRLKEKEKRTLNVHNPIKNTISLVSKYSNLN